MNLGRLAAVKVIQPEVTRIGRGVAYSWCWEFSDREFYSMQLTNTTHVGAS